MGKTANRIGAPGVFAAAVAALLLPGSASADTADPAMAGSCDATLRDGGTSHALTVDAGAPLNMPHVLTVGTGSDSAGKPLLSLPVADLARTLDVGGLPVAGQPVSDAVCPAAQNTVNALSATTQGLVAGAPLQPSPPSSIPPPPAKPVPPVPPALPTPNQGLVGTPEDIELVSFPPNGVSPVNVPDLSALIAPGAIAPSAVGAVPPASTAPTPASQNSGTAEALPAAVRTPAKLPLLLAAIAFALVAAALSKVWIRRSA